jgi:hypothetical protein
MHVTYERNTRGPREGIEGNNPIHINVSVEPINPCATNTPKKHHHLDNQILGEGRQ